jgi:AmiR/NasT family two-component response regulator
MPLLPQVEYLKAQLASEQAFKSELEASVASMKEKLLKQKQVRRHTGTLPPGRNVHSPHAYNIIRTFGVINC